MKISGPFNIIAGQVTTITPPDNQSYGWVVVFNSITTEQLVNYGADEQWLQPLMANAYQLASPSTVITLEPQSTKPVGTELGSVTSAWYLTTEPQPTGYPLPITASNVSIASGTAVTITGQPLSVDINSTTVVPTTKTESVIVGTGTTSIYSNTSGANQYCTNLSVANPQTVTIGVTVELNGNPYSLQVPAGDTRSIDLPYPFLIPNNTSITGITTVGNATVSVIVTG